MPTKLLDVVNVAEERVDDNLIDILKLRFGRDFDHDHEDEVWSRF